MNINPTSPQGPRSADPQQLESHRAAEARSSDPAVPAAPEPERPDARSDSVDVSADAKALVEGSEARASRSTLSPDRLKEIGDRLATGHYDQPEVIDEVARRLSRDPVFRTGE